MFNIFGFVKFTSHVIRLLLEGIELLETGDLQLPLKDKDLLLSIRRGDMNQEELLNYVKSLQEKCEEAYKNSQLPSKPNFKEVEEFQMSLLQEFFKK